MKRATILLTFPMLLLTGCVQFDVRQTLSEANESLPQFTNGNLQLLVNDEQRNAALERVDELLQKELTLQGAVEIALKNSPGVQAMLSEYWADSSGIALSGSIPNPVFEFGRLTADEELEIERMLSIGLLDLIRLPVMKRKAELRLDANRLMLSSNVVDRITKVKNTWVNAVAEKQLSSYAEQVFSSAEASAKLAANMQAIGNFNAISRARQQSYYANAATNLTTARHAALAAKEALIRALGLDATQAALLKLPQRLDELPERPLSTEEVISVATENRLDVQMGIADLKAAGYAQGISVFAEATDIEIAGISETVWKEDERESARGFEIGIELPIFKSISKIPKHYRDEIVPLQQLISEENVLNYNGMIIGVFELLADSRTQIEAVQSAIQATRQFWVADAALRSSMVGKPVATTLSMAVGSGEAGGEEH